jgi:hypothetical protein
MKVQSKSISGVNTILINAPGYRFYGRFNRRAIIFTISAWKMQFVAKSVLFVSTIKHESSVTGLIS